MQIYADNAATTKPCKAAIQAMVSCMEQNYGNPSSVHHIGQAAAEALLQARQDIAACLGCSAREIYFTSGGSEADNQALRSAAYAGAKEGKKHIISTVIEHHAILHTLKQLEEEGFSVTLLEVSKTGIVTPEQVAAAIRPDTCLVSVMFANNEIGTIEPIAEIGAVCREKGVLFHTDAVQAAGHIPIDVKAMGIDMLSISGHKFHGPKGVGVLYERKGIRLPSYIIGGEQEKGRRAGTENVAGIVGLGEALELAVTNMSETSARMTRMRDRLIEGIEATIPEVKLNGHRTKRLPNNVNFSIKYIEGESILLMLDMAGIAASSGSACTSGSLDPSHVLMAIGLKHEVAHGSLRLSLSELTTEEDIDYIIAQVPPIVEGLRAMSPVWEKIKDK